ncbi:molybdopterin-dependent oxidoreductase [Comamonas sp. Y33R10-2]|uniref:molybdopterin-dependent oxidoreductase n=1 Tax=Comamonas sp. Y33R10-2 TaxID=2853257 RepID=UPI001C5C9FE3|nr:molybdopterin-dependent oxidoreductase [Comamonas sp. Y33R10-2]QXZ10206.1 molybdopterin-dependent oxidoreductase [Comamonas sp. Y33R10-2]
MAAKSLLSRRSLLQGGTATAALSAMALPGIVAAARPSALPASHVASGSPAGSVLRSAHNTCVLDGLQPIVLTISGTGVQANRGKPQAVADHMLNMHGHRFDAAWSCGLDALNSLKQHSLTTQLEYDETEHRLQGPLLEHVLQAAGIDIAHAIAQGHQLTLQGIDGYRTQIPLAQAVRWRMLLATELDGLPLSMGGVGPLWVMFAPQHIPELSQLPIKQRFAAAVWGLYYIQLNVA